ncbi:hypothetical protein Hanom_Chr09g00793011 [Helianthus anomalus]
MFIRCDSIIDDSMFNRFVYLVLKTTIHEWEKDGELEIIVGGLVNL